VSNYFRAKTTEMEYSSREGNIVNFSVSCRSQYQYFSNYFIPNSYDSLHNEVLIVTAGCMYVACV